MQFGDVLFDGVGADLQAARVHAGWGAGAGAARGAGAGAYLQD